MNKLLKIIINNNENKNIDDENSRASIDRDEKHINLYDSNENNLIKEIENKSRDNNDSEAYNIDNKDIIIFMEIVKI